MAEPQYRIKELERHEPIPTDEEKAEAIQIANDALRTLALSSSVLASYLMNLMRRVITTAVDTYAVELAGDGFPMLLINPSFAKKLGKDQSVFVMAHEAYHLINMHLFTDKSLFGNPNWTLATEATINYAVMELLGTPGNPAGLPQILNDKTGKLEETGVNPRKVYEKYRDDLRKQGKDYVSERDFYRTDLTCYAELERMSIPPKMKGDSGCVHGQPGNAPGQGDGQGPGQGDQPHLDPAEVGRLAQEALDHAMHGALVDGNEKAKQELLKLSDRSDGSEQASKIWGDMGIGALRGETLKTQKTNFWQQFLMDFIAERIMEGERLKYQRKVWWDPRVAHRGEETYKKVLIAVDASGSMCTRDLEFIASKLGETEGVEYEFLSFDGVVAPFTLGEPILGGGGTNFQIIEDYVRARASGEIDGIGTDAGGGAGGSSDGDYDAILVVTDGYAAKFSCLEPEKYAFIITPNGSPAVPESMDIAYFEIDPAEMAA